MTTVYRFKAYFSQNEEPAVYKDFENLEEAERAPNDLKHLSIVRYKISQIELDNSENIVKEVIISTMSINA